jgi:DNA-binding CsgD family transcriptional regulator/tetratricopeptide (TPR) repeat protein
VEALRPLPAELGVDAVRELTGPSWRELARLLPSLGVPDTGSTGQAAQARLFELLLGLLDRLSDQTPVTLIVEDLHWADQSTRDLLAFLVRNLRRERMLLVATYRSDEPHTNQLGPWLAELDRVGPVQRLELPRLDRTQTLAQLVGILGATPAADLVEVVFTRSEGNPFFTEELLATVRAGSRELPATLRDLLRGRIEGLSEPARQVLAVVAVAGRQVPHRLLAAVAGLADQQLDGALREAVASQLLVTRPGQDGYDVRHALLREVVETGLLPGERARLHADLAQALSEQPQVAGVSPAVATAELAVHWDAAGEAAQALSARLRAGQAAERAHGFPEARDHYERALELWELVPEPDRPTGLDRVDLLDHAAQATISTGAVGRAIELVEAAIGRVDPAGQPVRAAVLLARLGDYHRVAGNETGALAAYHQAERLLAGTPPSTERARVLASHARTLNLTWQTQEAVRYCEEAIAVARTVGARAEEAHALSTLGMCMDDLGDLDRGAALQREARQIAEAAGDAECIMRTYTNLNHVLAMAGRERDALEDAREGYQRARQFGLERGMGGAVAASLAMGLLVTGRWDECAQFTAEALVTDNAFAFGLHAARGLLLTRRGDFATARDQLERSMRLSPPATRDPAWRGLAELAIWEGRDREAQRVLDEWQHWYADMDPEGMFPQLSLPRYGLLLRLEADRAERAAARRSPVDLAEARSRGAPVAAELDRLAATQAPQARLPLIACELLLARAELSRLEGQSDAQRWEVAVAASEQLEHRFEAAYARFRLAEALLAGGAPRGQVESVLRPAYQTTVALRAAPLQREIELLAQRGRLRLEESAGAASAPRLASSPAASLGLTQREAEVLALVAEGRTNRQIGQELFISPKTASVHVSRILTKLGVAGRGQAAAIAHRLGLQSDADE